MQFVTASLGVECEYCHVKGDHGLDFDKDDKKTKQAARKMMEMMFAINKDNFEGHRAVTCYSCHRGRSVPQATPAVMSAESKEAIGEPKKPSVAVTVSGNTAPTPEKLLDQYVQALG